MLLSCMLLSSCSILDRIGVEGVVVSGIRGRIGLVVSKDVALLSAVASLALIWEGIVDSVFYVCTDLVHDSGEVKGFSFW